MTGLSLFQQLFSLFLNEERDVDDKVCTLRYPKTDRSIPIYPKTDERNLL